MNSLTSILRTIYLILLFNTLAVCCSAQDYIQTNYHYNLEKGLESRNVRSTFKDSRGFMWVGTEVGAYLFDGFEFHPFKRKRNNKLPLSVERIAEDEDGNLWFTHFDRTEGVSNFVTHYSILPKGDNFLIPIEEYFKDKLPFPISESFKNIGRYNNENGIWIASQVSREIYEYIDGSFKKIGLIPKFVPRETSTPGAKHFFSIDKDSNGTNWLSYDGHLYFSDPTKGFVHFEKLPFHVLKLKIDADDRFWFTYGGKIYSKESKDSPFRIPKFVDSLDEEKIIEFKIESINAQFIAVVQDAKENLLLIDHQNNQVTPLEKSATAYIDPNHVFIDKKNTIWLSSHEGLSQITFQKSPFKQFLKGKSTRGISENEDGDLFVASYAGLYQIDAKLGLEKLVDKKIALGQAFYKDSRNKHWLGGSFSNFYEIISLQPFEKRKFELAKDDGTVVNFFDLKNDSIIWMGTDFGLITFNIEKDEFTPFDRLNGFNELNNSSIYDFEALDESNFLIGTSKGLFEIEKHKGVVNHYNSSNSTLPYDFITFVHQDAEDNSLWFGTKSGGLINWEFPNGKPIQITTKDGLADNTIYAIYEDKINLGFLWLPSNNGLMHFNKKTGEVTNYKTKDGIAHDEFNFQSHYEAKDGNLYFGGIQGVTSFNPKEIDISAQRPQLNFMSFEYFDNKSKQIISDLVAYNNMHPISLNSTCKSFELVVASNDYNDSAETKYFSKIEGVDDDWVLMDKNSLFIKTLPTGKYNILIKAKNSKGIWAENQINVPIKMSPPFYLRWWFLLLMALLFFGLIATIIKGRTYKLEKDKEKLELEVTRRTQQIEKQAEELRELDKVKSHFFSNVTHELRTPLTLIIGPLKQLLKSGKIESAKVRKTLTSVAQNSVELQQLVEEILDLNRLDAKKLVLNKEPVRFRNVVNKWINSFEPEAENRKIHFKLDYAISLNLYLNLDVQKLDRIVTNLLSNAFKYSESGDTIILKLRESENKISIIVKDTGLGIHKDDLPNIFQRFYQTKQAENNLMGGLGIGLALSKELSALMDGQISVESELASGSIFTFSFPKEISKEQMIPAYNSIEQEVEEVEHEATFENGARKNILIVEDNLKMQAFVVELLDPFANTKIAINGKVALELLNSKDNHFDLIVSDVMMPEMDGFTLLNELKQDKQWQLTPVVLLTARADIHDKIKALTIGVDDYIVKPFEPAELIARVKNLLEKLDFRKVEIPTLEDSKSNEYKIINEFEITDSAELQWLKEVEQIAIEHISLSNFNVVQFAAATHIGEKQLGRRLKKLTGMTAGAYLKEVRLQKARHYLENNTFSTIAEAAYNVGFTTPEYFTRTFKKRFGKVPKEFFNNK